MSFARPAQSEDREMLDELLSSAKTELQTQRGGEIYMLTEVRKDFSNLETELESPSAAVVVGIFEDLVVGWGSAREYQIPAGPKIGKISELYVQPEARDIGVGEDILAALLDWVKAAGCQGVEGTALPGNREMKGIFERFGIKTRMLVVYKDIEEE